MRNTRYQTDLTEAEFELIKPCLQVKRQSKWDLINIFNAILYVCDQGIKWRAIPADYAVSWQTVYWYFYKWSRQQSWTAINEALVMAKRQRCGADPLPSVSAIDSQSAKNTPTATSCIGFDGGKKIKGRKRMLLVDSLGNLLAVNILEANRHDGPAALKWWHTSLSGYYFFENLSIIRADHHFGGVFKKGVESTSSVRVEVMETLVEKASQKDMPVHKGRWVVERTIAWELNSRRLYKDNERLPRHSEALLLISSISRLIRNKVKLK